MLPQRRSSHRSSTTMEQSSRIGRSGRDATLQGSHDTSPFERLPASQDTSYVDLFEEDWLDAYASSLPSSSANKRSTTSAIKPTRMDPMASPSANTLRKARSLREPSDKPRLSHARSRSRSRVFKSPPPPAPHPDSPPPPSVPNVDVQLIREELSSHTLTRSTSLARCPPQDDETISVLNNMKSKLLEQQASRTIDPVPPLPIPTPSASSSRHHRRQSKSNQAMIGTPASASITSFHKPSTSTSSSRRRSYHSPPPRSTSMHRPQKEGHASAHPDTRFLPPPVPPVPKHHSSGFISPLPSISANNSTCDIVTQGDNPLDSKDYSSRGTFGSTDGFLKPEGLSDVTQPLMTMEAIDAYYKVGRLSPDPQPVAKPPALPTHHYALPPKKDPPPTRKRGKTLPGSLATPPPIPSLPMPPIKLEPIRLPVTKPRAKRQSNASEKSITPTRIPMPKPPHTALTPTADDAHSTTSTPPHFGYTSSEDESSRKGKRRSTGHARRRSSLKLSPGLVPTVANKSASHKLPSPHPILQMPSSSSNQTNSGRSSRSSRSSSNTPLSQVQRRLVKTPLEPIPKLPPHFEPGGLSPPVSKPRTASLGRSATLHTTTHVQSKPAVAQEEKGIFGNKRSVGYSPTFIFFFLVTM
ncbi:hypothetical protein DM01DRAFT_1123499 [Hesseltinella vesiculosa]|uniref:Uncharacterized protein n=1 Tax=Hesseltinella vesiculosa TaxID=101127 RepID=A0A1X2GU17_9FUNG|nr:hypothetical protein DM01DRAFT_1123499 [Hesseltinella vesiculosa]